MKKVRPNSFIKVLFTFATLCLNISINAQTAAQGYESSGSYIIKGSDNTTSWTGAKIQVYPYISPITGVYLGGSINILSGIGSTCPGDILIKTGSSNRINILGSDGSINFGSSASPSKISFYGTTNTSYFLYGTNQDIYIRPGKDAGKIVMDKGPLSIGTANTSIAKTYIKHSNWQLRLENDASNFWYMGTSSSNWSCGNGKFIINNVDGSTNAPFCIDVNGYIGIWASSPSRLLTLGGSTSPYMSFKPTSTNNEFVVGSDGYGFIIFDQSANSGSGAYRMIVDKSGNVGIGCVPVSTTKLAVNGRINASEVVVTSTVPTADYVFHPQYKLKPLHEVEKFVKENNHLPEVPSAEEFKNNGYSVGEMDNLLLKKVEELTLYTIELNKQIEALKQELEKSKN